MTPAEEYAELIRQQDIKQALALAENKRLREEVAGLVGITMTQQAFDRLLAAL
jgi:hypothetical protein